MTNVPIEPRHAWAWLLTLIGIPTLQYYPRLGALFMLAGLISGLTRPSLAAFPLLLLSSLEFGYFGPKGEIQVANDTPWVYSVIAPVIVILCALPVLARRRLAEWPAGGPTMVAIWLVVFPAIAACTFLGYQAGNFNWTRSIRSWAAMGALLYGIAACTDGSRGVRSAVWQFTILCVAVAILDVWVSTTTHVRFICAGLAPCAGLIWWREGKYSWACITFASGLVLTWNASITTIAITGMAFGGLLLTTNPVLPPICKRWGLLIVFSVLLAFGPYMGARGFGEAGNQLSSEQGLSERISFKIFGDRLLLWVPAYNQVVESNAVFVPSGRPLVIDGWGKHELTRVWGVGAHNTPLELLRMNGLLGGGGLLVIILMVACILIARVTESPSNAVALIGCGVISIIAVGSATGDFVIDSVVGQSIWLLAGYCLSVRLTSSRQGRRLVRLHPGRRAGAGAQVGQRSRTLP